MARLPVVSGADAVRALTRGGWRIDHTRGLRVRLLMAAHFESLATPQH
jgi:predicted RNA binding protein YcfA (HicA-like mRNA interferase family)